MKISNEEMYPCPYILLTFKQTTNDNFLEMSFSLNQSLVFGLVLSRLECLHQMLLVILELAANVEG